MKKRATDKARTDNGRRNNRRPMRRRQRGLLFQVAGALGLTVPLAGLLLASTMLDAEGRDTLLGLSCWVLVAAGVAGTTLASRERSWGWLLLFGLQPLWIAYALATEQYGLILGSMAYGVAQLNGFVRSSGQDQRQPSSQVAPIKCQC